MKNKLVWILLLLFTSIGCIYHHYFHDKLIIKNIGVEHVRVETFIKLKNKLGYKIISGGVELLGPESRSPLVRRRINYQLEDSINDGCLYLLYYNLDKCDSFNSHFSNGNILDSQKLIRYSRSDLNKMNWTIELKT